MKNNGAGSKKDVRRLIPQEHGGALLSGGVPGNAGGTGRPPSEVRARLRGSFEERIPVLEQFMDGQVTLPLRRRCEHCGKEPTNRDEDAEVLRLAPSPADILRAFDIAGKYGLGTTRQINTEHVRERLRATLETIRDQLTENDAARLIAALKPIWT